MMKHILPLFAVLLTTLVTWTDAGAATPTSDTYIQTISYSDIENQLAANKSSYVDVTVTKTDETDNAFAVTYKGHMAGGNTSLQLRSSATTTGSGDSKVSVYSGLWISEYPVGYRIKDVTLEWNSTTADGRTINFYCKDNVAMSAGCDMYAVSGVGLQSTKIGDDYTKSTDVQSHTFTLPADQNIAYLGLRSKSGALYLTSVTFTWEKIKPLVTLSWTSNEAEITDNTVTFKAKPHGNNLGLVAKFSEDGIEQEVLTEIVCSSDEAISYDSKYEVIEYLETGEAVLSVSDAIVADGDYRFILPEPLTVIVEKGQIPFSLADDFKFETLHERAPYNTDTNTHTMGLYEFDGDFLPFEYIKYVKASVEPLFTPVWDEEKDGANQAMHEANHYFWYGEPSAEFVDNTLMVEASVPGKYRITFSPNEDGTSLFEGYKSVDFNLIPQLERKVEEDGQSSVEFWLFGRDDSKQPEEEGYQQEFGYFVAKDGNPEYFALPSEDDPHWANVEVFTMHRGAMWYNIERDEATVADVNYIPVAASEEAEFELPADKEWTPYHGSLDLRNAKALHLVKNVNGMPLTYTAYLKVDNSVPTGVGEIGEAETGVTEWYTLEGLRVNRPVAKGCYVVRENGRSKVVIIR